MFVCEYIYCMMYSCCIVCLHDVMFCFLLLVRLALTGTAVTLSDTDAFASGVTATIAATLTNMPGL